MNSYQRAKFGKNQFSEEQIKSMDKYMKTFSSPNRRICSWAFIIDLSLRDELYTAVTESFKRLSISKQSTKTTYTEGHRLHDNK